MLIPQLELGLFERSRHLRLCLLAAIAGESVFLWGPPGTGKSLIARRLNFAFSDARSFDYLMGRFSTPEEVFGPVSIKALRDEDRYVRRSKGYLPEAEIVFLDEIWKASPPIQNALLTALNEKLWLNGDTEIQLPLKLLIAASNEGPSDDTARAFWDRFLLRVYVAPLKNPDNVRKLLSNLRDPYHDPVEPAVKIGADEWQAWTSALQHVTLDDRSLEAIVALRQLFQDLHRDAKAPYISDRRWKKAGQIVRASALCHGRITTNLLDLGLLPDLLWDLPEQYDLAWDSLRSVLSRPSDRAAGAVNLDEPAPEQVFETVELPVLLDQEYYQIVLQTGLFPENFDELRIWKEDYESLSSVQAQSCECFVYTNGTYDGSKSLHLQKTANGVAWDGQQLSLTRERKAVALAAKRHSASNSRERAVYESAALDLRQTIASLKTQEGQHLFLPSGTFDFFVAGMESDLQELVKKSSS